MTRGTRYLGQSGYALALAPAPWTCPGGRGKGQNQNPNQRTGPCNAKNSSIVPSKT